MRKFLIIILLFVLFVNFISADDCNLNEDNLRINIGIYDKIPNGEEFIFKKSKFQPNSEGNIVQEGDVLLVESFEISLDSLCYDLQNEIKENGIKIAFILPNENHTSESIKIPVSFIKNENTFKDSFEIKKSWLKPLSSIDHLHYYKRETAEEFKLNEVTLDKVGRWEIFVIITSKKFRDNIFNEDVKIQYGPNGPEIKIRDRAEIFNLENSKKEANRNLIISILAILVSIIVAWAGIFFMRRTSNEQIEKMEEHFKKEIKIEEEREKQKQINLLKSLEIQLKYLSEGDMDWNLLGAKSLVEGGIYPAYQIWKIETFHYLINLSFPEKESEINKLKESLIKIDEKISIINNYLYGKGLDISKEAHRKAVTKLIDGTIEKVKKLKRFIEENFDIKSKK